MSDSSVSQNAGECPACGHTTLADRAPYNGYEMKRCARCSLLFTAMREIPVEYYDNVYKNLAGYRELINDANQVASGEMGLGDLEWYKARALRFLEHRRGGKRLLDIGCGPGTFMVIAERRGWEVVGVEPAGPAVATAQRIGLNVIHGTVSDLCKREVELFMAVTCFEVLEHVPKPVEILALVRGLLVDDGFLVATVPNVDDPYCLRQKNVQAMPPVHINFFNRRSLSHLVKRAGLEVVRFFTLPIPTSSVRNVCGKRGFILRLPLLAGMAALKRADGTTLMAFAKPKARAE